VFVDSSLDERLEARAAQNAAYASLCALCFGLALLVWGLVPAVIERLVTHRPPELAALALGTVSFLLGIAYIGLHLLMRRRIVRALWTTFGLSLVVVVLSFGASAFAGTRWGSAFLMLMACATAFTSWLAIHARPRPAESARRPSRITNR